jgi:hypothetical protein
MNKKIFPAPNAEKPSSITAEWGLCKKIYVALPWVKVGKHQLFLFDP